MVAATGYRAASDKKMLHKSVRFPKEEVRVQV